MKVVFMVIAGLMLLLMAGLGLWTALRPERLANEEHRALMMRVHRAMRRRPVLFFAVPLVLAVATAADQVAGVVSGDKPAAELLFPILGMGITAVIVRMWCWPDPGRSDSGR